jgi:nucleoside-triphosphatase THEP1
MRQYTTPNSAGIEAVGFIDKIYLDKNRYTVEIESTSNKPQVWWLFVNIEQPKIDKNDIDVNKMENSIYNSMCDKVEFTK